MATVVIPIPDTPRSRIRVSLAGRFYRLRFRYSTRADRWSVDVFDDDERPLLLGKRLVPGADLLAHHVSLTLPDGVLLVLEMRAGAVPNRRGFVDEEFALWFGGPV